MNSDFARIKNAKVIHDGEQQALLAEFNDGKVRQFSAKELYEATGYLGQPPRRRTRRGPSGELQKYSLENDDGSQ